MADERKATASPTVKKILSGLRMSRPSSHRCSFSITSPTGFTAASLSNHSSIKHCISKQQIGKQLIYIYIYIYGISTCLKTLLFQCLLQVTKDRDSAGVYGAHSWKLYIHIRDTSSLLESRMTRILFENFCYIATIL